MTSQGTELPPARRPTPGSRMQGLDEIATRAAGDARMRAMETAASDGGCGRPAESAADLRSRRPSRRPPTTALENRPPWAGRVRFSTVPTAPVTPSPSVHVQKARWRGAKAQERLPCDPIRAHRPPPRSGRQKSHKGKERRARAQSGSAGLSGRRAGRIGGAAGNEEEGGRIRSGCWSIRVRMGDRLHRGSTAGR